MKLDVDVLEKELAEIAKFYAYAIVGGLTYSWKVPLSAIKNNEHDDIEFIQAQFIFAFREFLDRIAGVELPES